MDDAYSTPSSSTADFDLRGRATSANTLGTISVVLSLLGYCSGYMTLLFALPLAAIAIHYARTVLAEDPDEVTAVYARNAMTMGVISAVFSSIFLLFMFSILLMYGAIIAAAIAGNL